MPPKGTKRARAGRLAAVTTRSASARRSASPSPVPSGHGHDDLDDDLDNDPDDVLDEEAHPTMRDLYALLKEQTQRIAELESRSLDGASSSSRDPVKSIEDDARALLSVALSDSASQRYQNSWH